MKLPLSDEQVNLSSPHAGRTSIVQSGENVVSFLLGGRNPSGDALQIGVHRYSFGDLETAAQGVARYLVHAGGRKGEHAILISENSFFWVASYLGTLLAGLVCVPLAATLDEEDFDHVLSSTRPRFGFLQAAFVAKKRSKVGGMQVVSDRSFAEVAGHPAVPSLAEVSGSRGEEEAPFTRAGGNDLAALMFTSGSTGKPRGVMVSHRNIIANTESIVEYLGLTESDRLMSVLPFHYCFGTSLLHTHLRAGASMVVETRFMYPEDILQRMQDTGCTGFAGVPSHFQILLRNSSLRRRSFPRLRYVQQAGGHLAPTFLRDLAEVLPTTRIFVMYGQTEATARLSYLPPDRLETKKGSIGKGIPGVHLTVVNDAGVAVKPGEVGEVVAEGENVALGYWNSPEESAVTFRNGRLYTGDLAKVDEDGFVFLVDRAREILKCGGKRVSCRQLEDRVLEEESVLEAAVIGVSDEILGEGVKLFVVPRAQRGDGLEERILKIFKREFPLELMPKEIVVLPRLPKNSSGKVSKQDLKKLSPLPV
jgi:long-chain acyl-CoA synthetase